MKHWIRRLIALALPVYCGAASAQGMQLGVNQTVLVSNGGPDTTIRDVAILPDGALVYGGFARSGSRSGIPITTPFLDNDVCDSDCGFVRVLGADGTVIGTEIFQDSRVTDLTVAPDGNIIVAGAVTCFADTPNLSTAGAAFTECGEGGWLQKRSAADLSLIWGTYVPGVLIEDTFPALSVNESGDVFLAGQTLPGRLVTTPNALLDTIPPIFGGNIGYLVRVAADGSDIPFSSYIGGPDHSAFIDGMIVEGDRALVVGYSDLQEIVGAGAFRPDAANFDGFALEVDTAAGSALRLGRFDGGANDSFFSVTGDLDGPIYVSGQKEAAGLEFAADAYQPASPAGVPGFVVQLDSQLSVVDGTYFSGSFFDGLTEIETLPDGNLVAAGISFSLDLPIPVGGLIDYAPSSAQIDFNNRLNHLVILTPDLNSVVYGSYIGGIAPDPVSAGNTNLLSGLAVGPQGQIAVSGSTSNRDFPVFADSIDVGADRARFGYAISFVVSDLAIAGPGILPAVAVNSPYSLQLTAVGTTQGRFEFEGGSLPPGVSLSETGLISGTPTDFEERVFGAGENNFPLNISLTDAVTGERTLRRLLLRVADILRLDTLTQFSNGQVGESFMDSRSVSGGLPPYLWSVDETSLPDGITVTPVMGGLAFSGTPTETGTFTVDISVIDDSNQTAAATFSFQVAAAAPQPSPPPAPVPSPGSSGGGGSISLATLIALLTLLVIAHGVPKRRRVKSLRRC